MSTDEGYITFDVETTGLDPLGQHRIWEYGYCLVGPDGDDEGQGAIQIRLDDEELSSADPRALEVGRFEERYSYDEALHPLAATSTVASLMRNRFVIAQPLLFDLTFVRCLLWRNGVTESWSHRAPRDLKSVVDGWVAGRSYYSTEPLAFKERSTIELADLLGVGMGDLDLHTAKDDAVLVLRMAREMGVVPFSWR